GRFPIVRRNSTLHDGTGWAGNHKGTCPLVGAGLAFGQTGQDHRLAAEAISRNAAFFESKDLTIKC
ncbi:MAG: hypothetical protein KBH10_01655, partial [Laribacter sp.]|nr:hypothetical protein [Laribacter sp.]